MTTTRPGKRFNRKDVANFGMKPAIILAVMLHLGGVGLLFAFGNGPKHKPMPKAIPVGLQQAQPITASGGKESKAAVARTTENKAKPNPKKKQPAPKKSQPKAAKKDVGLKKPDPDKKKKTQPKPPEEEVVNPVPDPAESERKPGNLGGTGGAEESGVAFEVNRGQADFSDQDIKFRDYFGHVHDAIYRRWSRSGLSGGVVIISFKIHRDGSASDIEVHTSSGKPYLDGPAKRAVLSATFPPLPQGFMKEVMNLKLRFRYE